MTNLDNLIAREIAENEAGAIAETAHIRPRGCICNPFDLAALGHMTNCPAHQRKD